MNLEKKKKHKLEMTYNPNKDSMLSPETQVSSSKRCFSCKSKPFWICTV